MSIRSRLVKLETTAAAIERPVRFIVVERHDDTAPDPVARHLAKHPEDAHCQFVVIATGIPRDPNDPPIEEERNP